MKAMISFLLVHSIFIKTNYAVIENKREYKETEILSKGVNSPFIGNKYYGFAKYTIVNGKIVYKN